MSPVGEVWIVEAGPNRTEVIQAIDRLLRYGYTSIYKRLKEGPLLIAVGDSARVGELIQFFRQLGATVGWRPDGSDDPLVTTLSPH